MWYLRPQVSSLLDPLKFICQPSMALDDAVIQERAEQAVSVWRLWSFEVHGELLTTFYDSVVCWGSSISGDRKKQNKLIKKVSSVLGCPLDPVEVVSDGKMAKLSVGEHLSPHAGQSDSAEQFLK